MDGGLSLIPIVIDQCAFQNAYFSPLLLVLLEHFLQLGIAQLCVTFILTIVVQLHCEEVLPDFVELVLLCADVHDSLDF
jgi:hypothetical protein